MGKALLIIVLGVSIMTSILMVNINSNTNRSLDVTVNFFKQTQARLIANSGVEIYLEKLRRNKSLVGTFANNSLMEGTFTAYVYGPEPEKTIRVNSTFMGVNHTTVVKAYRKEVTVPPINSALYVSSDNLGLNLNGNVDINGFDHDINGNQIAGSSLPGIAVDDKNDSAYVVDVLKSKIAHQIQGTGASPSVKTVADTLDWKEITENYIFASDITMGSGTYSSEYTFGTNAEPKITYMNGNVHLSGTCSGSGIMIVNGNLTLSGQFNFKGIIIVYGQSVIETKVVGNSGVIGATIFVGQSVDVQATGNSKFYYSAAAINNAKTNLKSSRFIIKDWWE